MPRRLRRLRFTSQKLLPVIRPLPIRTAIVGEEFANASAALPPAVYFAKTSPSHSTFADQNDYRGGRIRECLGGFAACGLLRKNFPQSSDLSRPERISWD